MHRIDKNKLSSALGKNFSPLDEIAVSIIKHKVIAANLEIPIEKNRYYLVELKNYSGKLKVQPTALVKRKRCYCSRLNNKITLPNTNLLYHQSVQLRVSW